MRAGSLAAGFSAFFFICLYILTGRDSTESNTFTNMSLYLARNNNNNCACF